LNKEITLKTAPVPSATVISASGMNPLYATIEEFAADGYTHVECFCPRCRVIRLRPMSSLPKISMGLTLDQLSQRLRCAECSGQFGSGSNCAGELTHALDGLTALKCHVGDPRLVRGLTYCGGLRSGQCRKVFAVQSCLRNRL
jgi:hypothetical protein